MILRFWDEADAAGVRVIVIDQGIDTSTPAGRLQRNMLAALAEFERELILERTRAGIARARALGRKFGAPRRISESVAREVRERRARGESLRMISQRMNIKLGGFVRSCDGIRLSPGGSRRPTQRHGHAREGVVAFLAGRRTPRQRQRRRWSRIAPEGSIDWSSIMQPLPFLPLAGARRVASVRQQFWRNRTAPIPRPGVLRLLPGAFAHPSASPRNSDP